MNRIANRQRLVGLTFQELGQRWGKSRFLIRRLVDQAYLSCINISASRYIPLREVERAEREGVGTQRRRESATKSGEKIRLATKRAARKLSLPGDSQQLSAERKRVSS